MWSWICSLELYFAACKLAYRDTDAAYCCSVALSLLRGTALQWYQIRAQRDPANIPTAYADLKASLLDQFAVINEGQIARDQLKTLS